MAYTPNEWGVGNLITASKMNKIERQLVVNTSDLDDIRNGVTVPTHEEFEDLVNNTVHVNEAQTLTTAQKDQARDNIEAASEEDVASLKSALEAIENAEPINILSNVVWVQGSIDPNNGSDSTVSTRIKTGFIHVRAGDVIRFNVSDGYQYCIDYYNASKEPITTERLHGLWQTIEQFIIVGSGVSYIRLLASTPTNADISPSEGSAVSALQIYNILPPAYSWTSGYYVNYSTGELVASASYEYTKINVSAFVGGTIKGITASVSTGTAGIAFYDVMDAYISGDHNPVSGTYAYNYFLVIPQNASYMLITREINHRELWCDPELPWEVFINNISASIDLERLPSHELTDPVITWVDNHYINYSTAAPTADTNYKYAKIPISVFRGGHISGVTGIAPNTAQGIAFTDVNGRCVGGVRNTTAGTYRFPYDLVIPNDASYILITLQKASESLWVAPTYPWDFVMVNLIAVLNDVDNTGMIFEVEHKTRNARHAPGNPTLLTLLHFSDLHHDLGGALTRIMSNAEDMGTLVDDRICTGDMVGNTSEQIASWWDSSVMTCIGNHETASYNASTGYDWTALSMADRDAYYIAPFESGWGITHTSGTSYYYKDYTTQKVRLIVMDAMLYTGTPGAEAETQTTWLANLLSDAITNNLHVLIAIHSPHGGATAKDCSFSRYGQGTMPTYSDCNTPQTVIDTVAAAITNGLHFIGYIVGHTHQDNIWDAEGDGSQLMYCVTCASTTEAQWRNSDQDRSDNVDAYNLITIDTANTLVKIIRGGGADMDDHMRTRKAICFNYSTGEIVGEVL